MSGVVCQTWASQHGNVNSSGHFLRGPFLSSLSFRTEAEPPGEEAPSARGLVSAPFFSPRKPSLLEAFVPECLSGTPSKSKLLMNYAARLRTSQASLWNWTNQANCKQPSVRQLAPLRARPKSLGLSPHRMGPRLAWHPMGQERPASAEERKDFCWLPSPVRLLSLLLDSELRGLGGF